MDAIFSQSRMGGSKSMLERRPEISSAIVYAHISVCETCPAIDKCDVVVCSREERTGTPLTAVSCQLLCGDGEIICKSFDGRLDWYPFNPCAITTTSSTAIITTVTTTTPRTVTKHLIPTLEHQQPLDTTTQVPVFSGVSSVDMLQDMEAVVLPAEPTAQKKKQSYGLSWLVSEPELELVLWIMFGVALLLMSIGFVGLGGFVCYRRGIKKQMSITTCPRYYDINQQRAYGIVAYDANSYSPAVESDKFRVSNGTCYWSPRPDYREPGVVRRISSNQASICSPCCNSARQAANTIEHNYVHHMQIPSTNYRLAEGAPHENSTYHLITFSPPGDSVEGTVICRPSTCVRDVSIIRGIDSRTASLEGHRTGLMTISSDRQPPTAGSSLSGTSPIPIGNDSFLLSTYHRNNCFRNGDDAVSERLGQIIQQQTKV